MTQLKLNVLHLGRHIVPNDDIQNIIGLLEKMHDVKIDFTIIDCDDRDERIFPNYFVSPCEALDCQNNAGIIHELIFSKDAKVIIVDNDSMPIDQLDNWRLVIEQINKQPFDECPVPVTLWIAVYSDTDKNPYKMPIRLKYGLLEKMK